jgi:hypothetical protein
MEMTNERYRLMPTVFELELDVSAWAAFFRRPAEQTDKFRNVRNGP